MKLEEFDYYLPKELIAQYPVEPRDSSRMMVIDRSTGSISHRIFREIVEILDENYLMVFNNTKVLPARLYGRIGEGTKVEVLLVKKIERDLWECLTKPAKKFRLGKTITFNDNLHAIVKEIRKEGKRILRFYPEGLLERELERIGNIPLPPYIKRKPNEWDRERYQTIFAKVSGSIAAPTAGLHFTKRVIEGLRLKGIEMVEVTLHVGPGTFKPLKDGDVEKQEIDPEYFEIPETTGIKIGEAKKNGKKILAVGTTVVRTLESAFDEEGNLVKSSGFTNLFIYPGYKFKIVDTLLTNFHLPKSSLILLVAAFMGIELTMKAYDIAVKERYRFYSYGDCMLII
ncbi:MAG: tRNA preQ1(34) S-adenosylmethionine ribosyltransferase-isomerase QueA [Thermosulfidibacteraceae bacterium]|jgi:S-adenosylmethionine:tRNA ribosyltransferase-isomerase